MQVASHKFRYMQMIGTNRIFKQMKQHETILMCQDLTFALAHTITHSEPILTHISQTFYFSMASPSYKQAKQTTIRHYPIRY